MVKNTFLSIFSDPEIVFSSILYAKILKSSVSIFFINIMGI